MEQIEFYCAICGGIVRAPSDSTAPRCNCAGSISAEPTENDEPRGAQVFLSQLLSVEIRFRCGACQQKLQIDAQWEGMILDCPACRALTKVPKWSGFVAKSDESEKVPEHLARLTVQEVEFLSADPPKTYRRLF